MGSVSSRYWPRRSAGASSSMVGSALASSTPSSSRKEICFLTADFAGVWNVILRPVFFWVVGSISRPPPSALRTVALFAAPLVMSPKSTRLAVVCGLSLWVAGVGSAEPSTALRAVVRPSWRGVLAGLRLAPSSKMRLDIVLLAAVQCGWRCRPPGCSAPQERC